MAHQIDPLNALALWVEFVPTGDGHAQEQIIIKVLKEYAGRVQDIRMSHVASFRCAAEFGRYWRA